MTLTVLFAASDCQLGHLCRPPARFDGPGRAGRHPHPRRGPETVDYIVYAPTSPLQYFTPYTNCKAVLSLWAG